MRKFTLVFSSFMLFGFASLARAQATRTWVSGVGDDANPCSRTAPCKTFAGAISKTASAGEINTIDPGGYGTVTITKPITIDGGGNLSSVLNFGTNGININTAGPNDTVTLRNIEINGAGGGVIGINVVACKNLIVENVKIYGQNFGPSGRGISIDSGAGYTSIILRHVSISNNSSDGVRANSVAGAVNLFVDDSHIYANGGSGIDLATNSTAAISNSYLQGNGSAGVFVENSGDAADVANSSINFNTFGINANSGVVDVYGCRITNNAVSIQVTSGGQVRTHGNNAVINNGTNTLPAPNVGQQ